MNPNALVASLERFAVILPAVVRHVAPADARWRPPSEDWSILEVVGHLADEEVEDFRTRLQRTLRSPEEKWPRIEPEAWAVERRYNEADLESTLARFLSERATSLVWLRSLDRPDWSTTHHHPEIGPLRAGDLLASWAAHDLLHLRQITQRLYQLTLEAAGDYSTRYAGQWTA